jgi:hypothetical protein
MRSTLSAIAKSAASVTILQCTIVTEAALNFSQNALAALLIFYLLCVALPRPLPALTQARITWSSLPLLLSLR